MRLVCRVGRDILGFSSQKLKIIAPRLREWNSLPVFFLEEFCPLSVTDLGRPRFARATRPLEPSFSVRMTGRGPSLPSSLNIGASHKRVKSAGGWFLTYRVTCQRRLHAIFADGFFC